MKVEEAIKELERLRKKGEIGYREKSLGVIVDKDKNYLLVQLNGYKENEWNFSGGGIEEGESPKDAILRELFEELGTDKFTLLKESPHQEKYDWPDEVIVQKIIEGKYFKGQNQHIFLLEFIGEKDDIKPDPGELRKIAWVKYDELEKYCNFPNQWKTVQRIIKSFEE